MGARVTIVHQPTLPEPAVRRLVEILGEDGVIVDRDGIDEFRDPYWIPGDDTYAASAVVQPTSVEQVRDVMRVANEFGVPVWPHSQGRNNGYGGPSPRVRGSIQIGLRRMNRVLEINEELAYAVVEPGVRWMDLYEAIEAGGHALMLSVPDIGWGSVIGNAMDSGATYMPYGTDFMSPCGLEVVLPDGDLLRTGMGALPDSRAWHVYRRSMGPALDPLFVQSNYGIVTKMGVWLKPKPEAYIPMTLTAPDDGDLEAVIDTLRRLRLNGVLEGVPAIYAPVRAASMAIDGPVIPPRLLSEEEIQALADRTGLGRWTVRAAIWGPADIAEGRLAAIRQAWGEIPGSKLIADSVYTPREYAKITAAPEKIQAGIRGAAGDRAHPRPPRRGRDQLLGRHLRHQRALLPRRDRDPVRSQRHRPRAQGVRRQQADGQRARRDGLRRVPRPPRLHGPRVGSVLLQRPRLPALRHQDQGRRRPQRRPLPRPPRHLAQRLLPTAWSLTRACQRHRSPTCAACRTTTSRPCT
jgi:hypothetical protein